MKKVLAALLCCSLLTSLFCGCGQKKAESVPEESVRLNLAGSTSSFRAMESVIADFRKLHPGCTIEYEQLQDYSKSLEKRLANNDDVDLFLSSNIQGGSSLLPYALDLKPRLDLSAAFDGLVRNFTFSENGTDRLYSVPLGGEVRGLYVNKTLLSSLGLKTPGNYRELNECCKALKDAGYVPLQGNPGTFGQLLMYPYVCNLIANSRDYAGDYKKVDSCEKGVSELFREPMSRLYDLVKNGYYDYKYVETTYGAFLDGTDDGAVLSFLNIVSGTKKDDVGRAAFLPGAMSLRGLLDKAKEDYHSAIEYEFILAPVGDKGGFAYLSPSIGVAVNKNSARADWAVKFLNYLFTKDVNKSFAEKQHLIPNTADALDVIRSSFRVDPDQVSQLGQVSFRYVFYDVMKEALMGVSKGNNPKYMQKDGTMYPLDHYLEALEEAFAKHRS